MLAELAGRSSWHRKHRRLQRDQRDWHCLRMVVLYQDAEELVAECAVVVAVGVVVVAVAVEVAEVGVEPGLEAVVNCQCAPR